MRLGMKFAEGSGSNCNGFIAKQSPRWHGTEYAKALALQSYLQGGGFTYSLDPPDDGYGTAALTNFLFVTKTGFCQQFAGSYAVLARAVGLPTRLAYGLPRPKGRRQSSGAAAESHAPGAARAPRPPCPPRSPASDVPWLVASGHRPSFGSCG